MKSSNKENTCDVLCFYFIQSPNFVRFSGATPGTQRRLLLGKVHVLCVVLGQVSLVMRYVVSHTSRTEEEDS